MKFYLTKAKVTAQAESLKDIEILVALKKGESVSLEGTFVSNDARIVKAVKSKRVVGPRWTREEDEELISLLTNTSLSKKNLAKRMGKKYRSVESHIYYLRKVGKLPKRVKEKVLFEVGGEAGNGNN